MILRFMAIMVVVCSLFTAGLLPAAEPEAPSRSAIAADAEPARVEVTAFRFTGNTLLGDEALADLVTRFVGKSCTISDLKQAAALITAAYHNKGYLFSRAYLPQQQLADGQVTIAVLEGRVERIDITGNERYSTPFLSSFLTTGKELATLTHRDIERTMLLLNSLYEDLEVKGSFIPGTEPGTTVLKVTVEEKPQLAARLTVNNYGSDFVSRHRFGSELTCYNAFGDGSRLSVTGILGERPDRMSVLSGMASMLLDGSGTMLTISALKGSFEVGREFADLGITNTETSFDLLVSRPLLRQRSGGLTAAFALRCSDADYKFLDVVTSMDRIRKASVSLNGDLVHNGGKSVGSLALSKGLGGFLGGTGNNDPMASRTGADNDFFVLQASAARLQPIGNGFSLLMRCAGQWSPDRLLAGEEWLLGGVNSIHGYTSGEVSGTKGWNAGIALRNSPLEDPGVLQFSVFLEHGYAWRRDESGNGDGTSLTGAGFGVASSFDLGVPAEIRVDLGWPLDPGDNALGDSPIVYFDAAVRL